MSGRCPTVAPCKKSTKTVTLSALAANAVQVNASIFDVKSVNGEVASKDIVESEATPFEEYNVKCKLEGKLRVYRQQPVAQAEQQFQLFALTPAAPAAQQFIMAVDPNLKTPSQAQTVWLTMDPSAQKPAQTLGAQTVGTQPMWMTIDPTMQQTFGAQQALGAQTVGTQPMWMTIDPTMQQTLGAQQALGSQSVGIKPVWMTMDPNANAQNHVYEMLREFANTGDLTRYVQARLAMNEGKVDSLFNMTEADLARYIADFANNKHPKRPSNEAIRFVDFINRAIKEEEAPADQTQITPELARAELARRAAAAPAVPVADYFADYSDFDDVSEE